MPSCCSSRFPNTMLYLTLSYKNRFSEKSKSQIKKLFPSHSTSRIQLPNTKGVWHHMLRPFVFFRYIFTTYLKLSVKSQVTGCGRVIFNKESPSAVTILMWGFWWVFWRWWVFWIFNDKGSVSYSINKNLSWDFLTGDVYGCHKPPGMWICRTASCQHCSVAFI